MHYQEKEEELGREEDSEERDRAAEKKQVTITYTNSDFYIRVGDSYKQGSK